MRKIRKKKMRARNRKPQKNRRSQSQTAKKQKSEEGKSARQRNPNTPIRNEFDVSPQVFLSRLHFTPDKNVDNVSSPLQFPTSSPNYLKKEDLVQSVYCSQREIPLVCC